jgi:hypothetical protein
MSTANPAHAKVNEQLHGYTERSPFALPHRTTSMIAVEK